MTVRNILYGFLISVFVTSVGFAQNQSLDLAEEYFNNKEYEKALVTYQKVLPEKKFFTRIHPRYLECLYQTKNIKEASKYLKSKVREYPENPALKIDQYLFLKNYEKEKDAQKYYVKILDDIASNGKQLGLAEQYLSTTSYNQIAIDLYLKSREIQSEPFKHAGELAELYKKTGNTTALVKEAVNYLLNESQNVDVIKNKLQNYMNTNEELDALETKLIEKIQEQPDNILIADLMIWLYVQKKDFEEAFKQAKAYDVRFKTPGNKTMEVAHISSENKDYETAIKIYKFIISEYRGSLNYFQARKNLIFCNEQLVKSTYPVNKERIKNLITDYTDFVRESGASPAGLDAQRSIALLYAFYLDRKDTAVQILDQIIQQPRMDKTMVDKCKLDMADIYVLENELDESALLYGQVEKDHRDEPLGHEAKLKNAKLSYYKGEFLWAQDQLDVLKLATSREIANDAMALSLFIQNALAEDTNTAILEEFSNSELLIFQNKYDEAEKILDDVLKKSPEHAVAEYVYWQKALISRKKSDYLRTIELLKAITKEFPEGLLSDDAVFTIATIYEENLNDKAKAKEVYYQLLEKFPGSIFTQEARKRYRILRGDKVN
jgi:predicted Zn-dependent protease